MNDKTVSFVYKLTVDDRFKLFVTAKDTTDMKQKYNILKAIELIIFFVLVIFFDNIVTIIAIVTNNIIKKYTTMDGKYM